MTDPHHETIDRLFAIAARQFEQGRIEDSRAQLDALLELQPDRPDALLLLAQVHRAFGNDYAETACLLRLASVMPLTSDLVIRLGTLQLDLHQHSRAVETLQLAVEADPDDVELRGHYAHILRVTRDRKAALEQLDRVLAARPDDASAQFEESLIHLAAGRLLQGWQHFERRHDIDADYEAPAGIPIWRGDSFSGKRLVVTTEGGYGDNVWAARFLRQARRRGGTISLQVRPPLKDLLSQVEGVDEFIDVDANLDSYDLYCPILSLPACLKVHDATKYPPARLTCRSPEDGRFQQVLARAGDRFRVGIIWSGSATYANNHHRAAPLEEFLPLLTIPNTQFYSLQKGLARESLRQQGLGGLIIETDDGDFAETAALVSSLDLIIMTDTAVAHVAGSLGVPVWNLVDYSPYWYFDADGDCPWYPGMRLFRQETPGDWRGVFERVRRELTQRVERHSCNAP
ncbi:MAG: tetratricopeptide repeat protein [Planctomycetaceae bacterium]